MFGIKIISEEKYRSEQKSAHKLLEINEELTKKNIRLELDIKDLREQNANLRSENSKCLKELNSLTEKICSLKGRGKKMENAGFEVQLLENPTKCVACKYKQKHCKKITVGGQDVCILVKPSFRTKK